MKGSKVALYNGVDSHASELGTTSGRVAIASFALEGGAASGAVAVAGFALEGGAASGAVTIASFALEGGAASCAVTIAGFAFEGGAASCAVTVTGFAFESGAASRAVTIACYWSSSSLCDTGNSDIPGCQGKWVDDNGQCRGEGRHQCYKEHKDLHVDGWWRLVRVCIS